MEQHESHKNTGFTEMLWRVVDIKYFCWQRNITQTKTLLEQLQLALGIKSKYYIVISLFEYSLTNVLYLMPL
jgi:hypothetical protein